MELTSSSPCWWAGFPRMLPAALGDTYGQRLDRSALIPSSSLQHPQIISPAQLRSWDKMGNTVAWNNTVSKRNTCKATRKIKI